MHDIDRFIDKIPFLGQLITGGDNDGLFVLIFNIEGNLDKPSVSVNPVATILPSIIRQLFDNFTNDDDKNISDQGNNANQ